MKIDHIIRGCARILVLTVTTSLIGTAYAGKGGKVWESLSGVDTMMTTIATKSMITGGLAKKADGMLDMDAAGNFMFNYSGDVYRPITNSNGKLISLGGPIGTVEGQAAFPMEFAMLAIGIYGYLNGGPMPEIPSKIDWTMNDITIVVDGTTYVPLGDSNDSDNMGLDARAFTGLGPVEIGQVLGGTDGMSMSVRMGGCFAVQAVDGPEAGKIGTECLNGSFTFDLSGIDLGNPFYSTLNGTGTSNCFTVVHEPMMMQ